jgi:hypothetical protein
MPTRRHLEIVILKEKEYRKLYERSFQKPAYSKAFTEKLHRAEFEKLDRGLRKALAAKWKEDCCGNKDFAMMDEGEGFGAWHHCGGIYSNRICCPQYVEVIASVLATLPHAALWTYHTACETWCDDAPLPAFGEFFIRGGKLYAPKDENDYAKVFGRQK